MGGGLRVSGCLLLVCWLVVGGFWCCSMGGLGVAGFRFRVLCCLLWVLVAGVPGFKFFCCCMLLQFAHDGVDWVFDLEVRDKYKTIVNHPLRLCKNNIIAKICRI